MCIRDSLCTECLRLIQRQLTVGDLEVVADRGVHHALQFAAQRRRQRLAGVEVEPQHMPRCGCAIFAIFDVDAVEHAKVMRVISELREPLIAPAATTAEL